MDAKSFYEKHGQLACEKVATSAGTNWAYFKQFVSGNRRPSPDLAMALVHASANDFPDIADQLDFAALLPPKQKAAA